MDDLVLFLIVCAVIIAVVGFCTMNEMIEKEQKAAADDEEFENRRAKRRAEVLRKADEVGRFVLMAQCETMYVGGAKNERCDAR